MVLRVLLAVVFPAVLLWSSTTTLAQSHPLRFLTLTLFDADTQQPIPEASVTVHHDDQQQELRRDRNGRVTIPRAHTVKQSLYVRVRPNDYASLALLWQAPDGAGIPAEYTLRMPRGTTIGGRVVDDTGNPVARAGVSLHLRDSRLPPTERLDTIYVRLETDDSGNWSYSTAPPNFDEAYVGAYHHDYVIRSFYEMKRTDPAELRNRTATVTLERGIRVEGVVTDTHGQPLHNARVGVGSDRVASNATPEIRTDHNGRFRFGAKPGELVVVTVKHRDHVPELVQFIMPAQQEAYEIVILADGGVANVSSKDQTADKEITLMPWGSIQGVARIAAKPAADARMQASAQRSYSPSSSYITFQSTTTANAYGEFTIERVFPGPTQVTRLNPLSRQGLTATGSLVSVEVAPGQHVTVQIGGVGRPVAGCIILPDELRHKAWISAGSSIVTKVDRPKLPEEAQNIPPQVFAEGYQQWVTTLKGKTHFQAEQKAFRQTQWYLIEIGTDGTCRVDERYTRPLPAEGRPHNPTHSRHRGRMDVLATAKTEFTIVPFPAVSASNRSNCLPFPSNWLKPVPIHNAR